MRPRPLFRVFANQDNLEKLWAVCAVNAEGQPQLPCHSEHALLDEALAEVIRINRTFGRQLSVTTKED